MDDSRIPILVGAGQVTQREPDPLKALKPIDLIAAAAKQAAEDAEVGQSLLSTLDTIVLLRSFSDTSWRFKSPFGGPVNPPKSLAARLDANQASRLIYTHAGGNMPQWSINRLFEMVTRGEVEAALVAGGEALATQKAAQRLSLDLDWNEDAGGKAEEWGVAKRGWSDVEDRHRMAGAIYAYPLFENGIRGNRGRSVSEHLKEMGKLFEGFSAVAAQNPLADRRDRFTATEIATPSAKNPFIGFPYTKLMNANAFIDQSAAVILTSVAKAKELGIPQDRWVYLHGTADAYDHWHISDRVNFYSSPAMRIVSEETFEMAGFGQEKLDFLDLYSCFPSAVQIACAEMGIAEDDPRGLSVTGGLPYFGGPGNNYVTHSIAEMMVKVRNSSGSFGMVTANGNYVTKQSAGIYSTTPTEKNFNPKDPLIYQAKIDAEKGPETTDKPVGKATVETYTVMHDREGPSFAILFGRLEDGRRFIANTPDDPGLLTDLEKSDALGLHGHVNTNSDGIAIFTPG